MVKFSLILNDTFTVINHPNQNSNKSQSIPAKLKHLYLTTRWTLKGRHFHFYRLLKSLNLKWQIKVGEALPLTIIWSTGSQLLYKRWIRGITLKLWHNNLTFCCVGLGSDTWEGVAKFTAGQFPHQANQKSSYQPTLSHVWNLRQMHSVQWNTLTLCTFGQE